jgi:hypothetical protein
MSESVLARRDELVTPLARHAADMDAIYEEVASIAAR